jgi:hypothetical protein
MGAMYVPAGIMFVAGNVGVAAGCAIVPWYPVAGDAAVTLEVPGG